jgi:hypothetical protein
MLFTGVSGQAARASMALGVEALKLSWKIVYLERNGKRFSLEGLAVQEALLAKLSSEQKQVFQWLRDGYGYLSLPVGFWIDGQQGAAPKIFSPAILREFLNLVLFRLREEAFVSYRFLKLLVSADGVLLLPVKGVAQDVEAGTFVARLCEGDVYEPLFWRLGKRSLGAVVSFCDIKTPAVFQYLQTLMALITLHEKYVRYESEKRGNLPGQPGKPVVEVPTGRRREGAPLLPNTDSDGSLGVNESHGSGPGGSGLGGEASLPVYEERSGESLGGNNRGASEVRPLASCPAPSTADAAGEKGPEDPVLTCF